MAMPLLINKTSMTDLENFLKTVCFLYEYFTRVQAVQIPNGDDETYSAVSDEIVLELLLELEIDRSDIASFVASAFMLVNSLEDREDFYEGSLGKFYYEHFKPIDFDYFGQTKMKVYSKKRRQLLSAQAAETIIVHVADSTQYVLANMEILDNLSHKFDKYLAEHNCIVRNEIDFKIAYIELFFAFVQTGASSNLYWIEGDSMDPDEAILKETLGYTSNLFEASVRKDKRIVMKRAA